MKKLYLWLLLLTGVATTAHAQNRPITGRVLSGDDQTGLPGANITVKGTSQGTSTDSNGNFKLSVASSATLVVSALGYQRQSVMVGNQSVISITLPANANQLSELVVTALGITQERKSLSYAA